MLRSSMSTMLTRLALAGTVTLGFCAAASAEGVHHRHHGARHVHRSVVRLAPPHGYVGPAIDDEAYLYGPGYRNGADDDLSTDSVRAGAIEPVPGPKNVDPRLAYDNPYSARGYEIEAPPISPALPLVPVLTPELLN